MSAIRKAIFFLVILFVGVVSFQTNVHGSSVELLGITWGDSKLITFDPYTGQQTGYHTQLNPNESFRGLAYDSTNNMLYALSQVEHNLYSIDPNTLDITHIGALAPQTPYQGTWDSAGMAYDPVTDSLYTTILHNSWPQSDENMWGELVRIDRSTGSLTSIGMITDGYVTGIAYNSNDGFLYGYALYGTEPSDRANFIKIDPQDGSMTELFETSYRSIFGLTYNPGDNVFYTMYGYYGELDPTNNTITTLAGNQTGVLDAMAYKDFYVTYQVEPPDPPEPPQVPLPGSALLLGSGFVALLGWRKTRRK
jgi:hypothetical protein